MLSIKIICVGKLKERFYTDAANEYIKRLSAYCQLEIIEMPEHYQTNKTIRTPRQPDPHIAIALDKERIALEGKIPDGVIRVALCIEGIEMDSHRLSDFLTKCAGRGTSRLCFIIGGSHGLHESVKNKADMMLSMSKMTFPHNLARVMLLEQLYRAFKIAEGGKYHK